MEKVAGLEQGGVRGEDSQCLIFSVRPGPGQAELSWPLHPSRQSPALGGCSVLGQLGTIWPSCRASVLPCRASHSQTLAGICSFFSPNSPELRGSSLPVRAMPLSHSLARVVTHRVTSGRTQGWQDGQAAPALLPV